MNIYENSMDEIKELKDRVQFLEKKYKELVEELCESSCQCGKSMNHHFFLPEDKFKEQLMSRIN